MSAGPHRLEAAGSKGIPQVVCPGAIDMVNFGPMDSVPEKYRERRLYVHNPNVTLMRTTPEECAELGRITAGKLNRAQGPVAFVMPLRGVSAIDAPGQPFAWNATNVTRQMRRMLIDFFKSYKARVRIVYVETPWAELVKRNARRSRPVPEAVLNKLAEKLEVPDLSEAQRVEWVET